MIYLRQQGATLMIVLMLLLMVTIVSSLAIRQSLVSLGIATHAQAQQLLMQNSDAAMLNVENTRHLVAYLARDGMFGLLKGPQHKNKELVFCVKASRAQFFLKSEASMIYQQNGGLHNQSLGLNGYCRSGASQGNFFNSNRRIVLTQVSIRFLDSVEIEPFQNMIRGTDQDLSKIEPTQRVKVQAISLIPNLSSASTAQIDQCLSQHLNQAATDSVTDCLTDLNVPFSTHVTEYTLGQFFL